MRALDPSLPQDGREAVFGGGPGAAMPSAAPVQHEQEVAVDLDSDLAPYQEATVST